MSQYLRYYIEDRPHDYRHSYALFDRSRGPGDADKIASVYDADIAQRIAQLLNAEDERVARQGVKLS